MKTKNTSFMAGVLIIGIIGASDSIAAAIEKPICGASAAKITRSLAITDNEKISSNKIASGNIASRHIINPAIIGDHIDAGIAKIGA